MGGDFNAWVFLTTYGKAAGSFFHQMRGCRINHHPKPMLHRWMWTVSSGTPQGHAIAAGKLTTLGCVAVLRGLTVSTDRYSSVLGPGLEIGLSLALFKL